MVGKRERVFGLHEDGLAVTTIAARVGVSAETVRGWLKHPRSMREAYAALPPKARALMAGRAA